MRAALSRHRLVVYRICIALAPTVVIAALATLVLDETRRFGVLLFLGLLAFEFVRFLLRSATSWLVFVADGRRFCAEIQAEHIATLALPPPDEFASSLQSHLQGILDDETFPPEVRLRAARFLGLVEATETHSYLLGLQFAFQQYLITEDAFKLLRSRPAPVSPANRE